MYPSENEYLLPWGIESHVTMDPHSKAKDLLAQACSEIEVARLNSIMDTRQTTVLKRKLVEKDEELEQVRLENQQLRAEHLRNSTSQGDDIIPRDAFLRHEIGKNTIHTLYAMKERDKLVECNEDAIKLDGGRVFTSVSNIGTEHYSDLGIKNKKTGEPRRCNGWTEVEYRKPDGSWEPTNRLR